MSAIRLTAAVVLALCAPAHAAPSAALPALPSPAFPAVASAVDVANACSIFVDGTRKRVKALERTKAGLAWLKGWDSLNAFMEDQSNALTFLQNVHPDPLIRDASAQCELRVQDVQSSLSLNDKLYKGARQTKLSDPLDRRALDIALESFEDSGVALAPAQRARAKKITDALGALQQEFAKNIRDNTVRVGFTVDELKGVPEAVWKDAPKDADGLVRLGVANPVYMPVMQTAESAAARERMWRAKTNEGGEANLKLLARIMELRREFAALFGMPSYADFLLRHRMVQSPAKAMKFLDEVQAAVAQGEAHDVAELREAKAQHLAQPLDKTVLQRWDTAFYSERVKRARYSIDAESFRPYFPPQESLQFVMRVAEKMFDIRYERVEGRYWQADVQAYAVIDNASGKPLGSLYVDLYPRDGKYGHAAVWPIRSAASTGGRTSTAALVVNFDRKGLTLEELETLLHEFGHSLHVNLSAPRWSSAGNGAVMRDFIEAPSQMLEDWVYDPKVLKVFQEVCPACKPLPADMVARAKAAKEFGKGMDKARQHLYASYDLALHGPRAADPLETWSKMEGATTLGTVPGTWFPARFGHLAGGYGAGYYGYLWSLVIAMDLRTAFAADKLDPKVGARYRATVLSQGAQKPPQQLVKDFLGRDMSSAAFFDYLKQ